MTYDALAGLGRFREAHPVSKARVDRIAWEYIACGEGEEALMLLPGAPGRGETAFQHILALEKDYKIIAPSYPMPLSTLDEMLRGLAGIIRAEGLERVHLVGGSYSGLIAQSFVRRYPCMVSNLVLSDTGVPRPKRAKKYAWYLRLLKVLPLFAIRACWRLGARIYLREIPANKRFWRAYFRELISTITKEECVGRLKIWIEFDRHSRFTPRDLNGRPGRILILQANGDSTFPPREQAGLRKLYPQARVVSVGEGGHAASIARRGEYIEAIVRFLTDNT